MKNLLNGMKILVIVAVLLTGGTAQAVTGDVYSDTFQGITFTFTQVDADTLSFEIEGTPSGDWTGVQYLGAFDLKDLGLDFGTQTATANGPGATNLAGLNEQLSASSVDCNSAASPPGSICFDISPDQALGTLPVNFAYTIDFSAPLNIASTGPHLQIVFTNTQNGPKIGSLYSQDVPLTDTDTPVSGVPEPSAMTLLGTGLLVLCFLSRRLKRR